MGSGASALLSGSPRTDRPPKSHYNDRLNQGKQVCVQNFSLTGLSVLIVEDDPLLQRQTTATLEKLGADVSSALELRAARQFAAGLDFDFV